jgi:hypothetical protein
MNVGTGQGSAVGVDFDWLHQVNGVSATKAWLSEESLRERLEVGGECDWRSSQCFVASSVLVTGCRLLDRLHRPLLH